MRTSLIHRICYGAWMIEPSFVHSHIHIIENLIRGTEAPNDVIKSDLVKSYLVPKPASASFNVAPAWKQQFDINTVAVFPMQDPIFKQDQSCGPYGTLTLMQWFKNAINSENVLAVVFDADCPGGEATNIETFANLIKAGADKKPVLFSFNGLNCSASYFAAAGTTKIFATETTDIVGSIGTMMSFLDVIPMLEAQGAKYHEIYADQSSLKNKLFSEALKGNYQPLKDQILNPYAEAFINKVKQFRPQITKAEVFKGETYMAQDGINYGLIDGIQTLEATIQMAYEMGMQRKTASSSNSTTSQSKNSIHMNFPKLTATINATELVVDAEKGSYLSAENIQAIEDKLVAQDSAVATLEGDKTTLTKNNAVLLTANDALGQEVLNLKAEVKRLGGNAAAGAAVEIKDDKIQTEDPKIDLNSAQHKYYKSLKQRYGVEVSDGNDKK